LVTSEIAVDARNRKAYKEILTYKMENGKWKMENGKWKMENGKWKSITQLTLAASCRVQQ
jgi:hypothetical protein